MDAKLPGRLSWFYGILNDVGGEVAQELIGLADSVERRAVRWGEAQALAESLSGSVDFGAVASAAKAIDGLVGSGRFEQAYLASQLLLACVAVAEHPDAARWYEHAADAIVTATVRWLVLVPDDRIFQRMCQFTDLLISDARLEENPRRLAEALRLAGRLRFGPYGMVAIGRRSSFGHGVVIWRLRLFKYLRENEPGLDPEAVFMPDAQVVLTEAIALLREGAAVARTLGDGVYMDFGHSSTFIHRLDRAPVLKALAQALDLAWLLEMRVPAAEITNVAREALAAMGDGTRDPSGYASVLFILSRHGARECLADARLPPVPLAVFRERSGDPAADDLARLSLEAAMAGGRRNALREILAEVRDALDGGATPAGRAFFLMTALHALKDDPTECEPEVFSLAASEQRLRQRARREGWPSRRLAASLAHLGGHAGMADHAADGMRLLRDAAALSNDFLLENRPAMIWAETELRYQMAVDSLRERGQSSVLPVLAECAYWYAALDFEDRALNCLYLIEGKLGEDGSPAEAAGVVAPLAGAASGVIPAFGDSVDRAMYNLSVALARLLTGDCFNSHIVQQLGKAYRFSLAQLAAGPETAFPGAADVAPELVARGSRAGLEDPADLLREEIILGSYMWLSEVESGDSPGQRLRNAQRLYNRELSNHISRSRSKAGTRAVQNADETAALVPGKTVLICMQLGEIDRGDLAIHLSAFTKGQVECTFISRAVTAREMLAPLENGASAVLRGISLEVMSLRDGVRGDPLFRVVQRAVESELEGMLVNLFGPLAERLDQWHDEGYEHLCIWPHGPLHFLPFHLIHHRGVPLADRWTVTTVPSLASLRAISAAPTREWSVVALGSPDGSGRWGLPREDILASHAETIARATGGISLTGPAATREALFTALQSARYVHIGAHGSHNVAAPVFQCVYLAGGDDDDDGRAFAHDVVRCDLRGLEVVTLAACQSALGRFDYGDNLQGLPAAILLAGAKAVVGCLWPVHPESATLFFTTFYESLTSGKSTLAAFRTAQRLTRAAHPQYRHWGAFSFLGSW